MLLLDKGIAITRSDKFRNQHIIITVYVPIGKQIKINRNIGWGQNIHFFNEDRDFDVENEERGWEPDIIYMMRANGLYTLGGIAADEWKNGDKNKDNDDAEDNNASNTPKDVNPNTDTYRYNSPSQKIDSLKLNLQKEQQRFRDSLIKEQNNIKRKEEENQKKLEKLNLTKGASEPGTDNVLQSYHPLASIGLI